MRILLIDVNCKYSSTGKIVYDLYTGVNASGDKAAICYGRGPQIEEKHIFKFGLDWETYLHALMTRVTGYTGCYSYVSTRRLMRFIKQFKPDVVHIHELHAYFVNLRPLLSYLKKNKIPTVYTLHCEFMYTGKCGYAFECEKWKTVCGKCPHVRDYPSSLLFDRTRSMFMAKKRWQQGFERLTVVTPSKWLADRAGQSFLKEYDRLVIHNGIDTEVFHPRDTAALRMKLRIGDRERIVLSVAPGIMEERKGGKFVLQLSEKMQREGVRFILVGADDVHIPHPDNVTILPRITDQNELAELYSLADVFLICSKRENFPTSCVEAQCCGASVYGFDTGGTAETMVGSCGALVKYGDLPALQEAVERALEAAASFPKADFAESAMRLYAKENMIARYIRLYRELMGSDA